MKITAQLVNNLVTGLLVTCALVVTGVVLKQQFASPPAPALVSARLESWQGLLDARPASLGSREGRIRVVEFSDYQCPFCADLEGKLEAFEARHPGSLSVIRYEYPLVDLHPDAMRAALVSKCASTGPAYPAVRRALFSQARQGLAGADLVRLAGRAGVHDVAGLQACLEDPATRARVEDDVATARRLGFKGTPVLVVDGDVITGSRDATELHAYLSDRL